MPARRPTRRTLNKPGYRAKVKSTAKTIAIKKASAAIKKPSAKTKSASRQKQAHTKSDRTRKRPKLGSKSSAKSPAKKPAQKRLAPALRQRIQAAVRSLKAGKSVEATAVDMRLKPNRLRKLLLERKLATEKNGHLIPTRRGSARILIYSDGQAHYPLVSRGTAAKIGEYLAALHSFYETNDTRYLTPFIDKSIRDRNRKHYLFETRPNVLYRLGQSESYDEIYELDL